MGNTFKQQPSLLPRNTNPIVQFVFDENNSNNVTKEDLFTKLKQVMQKRMTSQKYIFTRCCNFTVKKWEVMRDSKMVCVKRIQECGNNYQSMLFDNQKNDLIFIGSNSIECLELNHPDRKSQIIQRCNEKKFFKPRVVWYLRKFIIIGTETGVIEIWDWETKSLFKTLQGHTDKITNLLIDEVSKELVSSSVDKKVKLWCLKTFAFKRDFYDIYETPKSICFIDKEKTLVVGTFDFGLLVIWNKQTGNATCADRHNFDFVEVNNKHEPNAESLIYSSCLGLLVSSASYIFHMKIWTMKNNAPLKFEKVKNPFGKGITTIEFLDPKKQTQVLVGDMNGNLFIVDLISKKVIWKSESAHPDEIHSIVSG